jgi:peptidoglycan/xylan/chitin deacetylase (PgdA/CDA1 family)
MIKAGIVITFLFFFFTNHAQIKNGVQEKEGAWIRSDINKKTIYLCFTAHEFMEGLPFVLETLRKEEINASFFLTGDFVRNHSALTKKMFLDKHYVGAHSDKHLLYCDWKNRDSLLFPIAVIKKDLGDNLDALSALGIARNKTRVFMPPYEWYNKEVAAQVRLWGFELINFTPGTSSNADYTTPEMKNYLSSDSILSRIFKFERDNPNGLNGFHLLIHVGTDPKRTDKLYSKLPELIQTLKLKGYSFARF